jgi:hypothetical protein
MRAVRALVKGLDASTSAAAPVDRPTARPAISAA